MIHWKRRKKIRDSLKIENTTRKEIVISDKETAELKKYIKRYYVEAPKKKAKPPASAIASKGSNAKAYFSFSGELNEYIKKEYKREEKKQIFTEYLKDVLPEFGMTVEDLVKKTCLNRSIKNDIIKSCEAEPFRPDKNTVLRMGIAMQMYVDEIETLLDAAGFTLSRSDKKDLIVKYHINKKIYDIDKIDKYVYKETGKSLFGE